MLNEINSSQNLLAVEFYLKDHCNLDDIQITMSIKMKKVIQEPILVPIDIYDFWYEMRKIIRQELSKLLNENAESQNVSIPNGFTEKPIYTIRDICNLFDITRPTMYEWIKEGKLKPHKNRGRVYFLPNHIRLLIDQMGNQNNQAA